MSDIIQIPKITLGNGLELEFDPKKMLAAARVDLLAKLPQQPIAISIGYHHYKGHKYPTPYGSYGDFSAIVGASKSKKTFLKSLLEACYLGGNAHRYAFEIQGHDQKDKYVASFDTEQSAYHTQRTGQRVIEMVGAKRDNYLPFALRPFSVHERLQFLEWFFRESDYKDNLGLVTIDGVADLVTNVNDEEQSYAVAQKLLEWSGVSNSHIITVLHRNFQSNKPTGHLGSAVLKKAETVLFVEADGDDVRALPEYTRNISFDEFLYNVDEDWLPYVVQHGETYTDYTSPNYDNEKIDEEF